MRILHVAPHLGGGVGRFLTNLVHADVRYQHHFCLLEQPVDTHLLEGISWQVLDQDRTEFDRLVERFDLIQIEFWNHPLLFRFLSARELIRCRVIVYAHVSGMYAPNLIPAGIFTFADRVVLSTPAAAEKYLEQIGKGSCSVIHEIGGVERTAAVERVKHRTPTIAYVGTASHAKLHPGFTQACASLLKQRPGVRFVVASNDDPGHLREEATELGVVASFDFRHRSNDVPGILAAADLFGYPMRRDHFGTGEQAILEAMGAGVPPVVLDNPAERSLVRDGVTGVIAHDIHQYVQALQYCLDHPEFTAALGGRARAYALESFSVHKTAALFDALYREIAALPKRERRFLDHVPVDPASPGWSLYRLCLGEHPDLAGYQDAGDEDTREYFRSKIMSSPHLVGDNKGGMRMYLKYFPLDPELSRFLLEGRPAAMGGQ